MKRVIVLLGAVVLFIVLVVTLAANRPKVDNTTSIGIAPSLVIGGEKINIELANTPEKRSLGLSNRKSLNESEGMLFIFDSQDINPAFWMKDMNFSIDIIWINDGKVVQIDKGVPYPEPQTPDAKLPLYTPAQPIDYVLEAISGFSEENEIEVGDTVDLSNILK